LADSDQIKTVISSFILAEFLEGEDPSARHDSTELMESGILDSLATLKLVTFLESKFGIGFGGDEIDEQGLRTVTSIANLVESKL